MKNNIKKILVLLPLTLLIWAIIIYKIFQRLNPPIAFETSNILKSETTRKIDRDSLTLNLNYRDPFLDNQFNDADNSRYSLDKTTTNARLKYKLSTRPWSEISYFGSIINQNPKKELYLIGIDTKKYLMRKGDRVNGYELKFVTKDSVVIKLINEYKTFKRSIQ